MFSTQATVLFPLAFQSQQNKSFDPVIPTYVLPRPKVDSYGTVNGDDVSNLENRSFPRVQFQYQKVTVSSKRTAGEFRFNLKPGESLHLFLRVMEGEPGARSFELRDANNTPLSSEDLTDNFNFKYLVVSHPKFNAQPKEFTLRMNPDSLKSMNSRGGSKSVPDYMLTSFPVGVQHFFTITSSDQKISGLRSIDSSRF